MFTYLDLLVVVFLAMIAGAVLFLSLMLLLKNPVAKRVFLYLTSFLAIYSAYVGIRINFIFSNAQIIIGALAALTAVAAMVLDILSVKHEKLGKVARALAAAALVVGLGNAIL